MRSRRRSAPAVAAASAALLRIALPLSASSTAFCSASRRGGVRVGVYIAIVVRTARHSDSIKLQTMALAGDSRFLVACGPTSEHYPHTTVVVYRFFLPFPPFFFFAEDFFFLVPPPEDDTLIRFGTLPLFARTLAALAAAASSSL